MRFFIYSDLPPRTPKMFESYGDDAEDVRDLGMRYAKDFEIANYAQLNSLCLITGDWDFSDIRNFPPEEYSGIVVIGMPDGATPAQILTIIRVLLDRGELLSKLPGK